MTSNFQFFGTPWVADCGILAIAIIACCILVKALQHWFPPLCCRGGWLVNVVGVVLVGAPVLGCAIVFGCSFIVVHLAIGLPYKIFTCSCPSLGFLIFNPLLVGTNLFLHFFVHKNPCYPICLRKYPMLVFLGVFCIVGMLAGHGCQSRRKNKKVDKSYADMNTWSSFGMKPTTKRISEAVTCHSTVFNEVIEATNSVLVVRKHDYVVFYSPAAGDPELYKQLAAGAERIFVFVPNMWHHGGADLFLKLFPNVVFFGAQSAMARHTPKLDIRPYDSISLPGLEFIEVGGHAYEEYMMYVKDEKVLATCDLCQGGPYPVPLVGCLKNVAQWLSGYDPDGCTFAYIKCLVFDIPLFAKQMNYVSKLDVEHVFGAHGGLVKKGLKDFMNEWKDYLKHDVMAREGSMLELLV